VTYTEQRYALTCSYCDLEADALALVPPASHPYLRDLIAENRGDAMRLIRNAASLRGWYSLPARGEVLLDLCPTCMLTLRPT